ncbi:uncharacterized protein LOC126909005 [Daktulosphaira vitifoliae]|uniref:uncharacterized protein LOC126909005 n=1 Tax=Daktulosphaira vitifoliae TaxID=58002 RepID=UPI0021AA0EC0|nr:uncharacterized protein LOC126909005 [Daktulosphaira vitifoliae]
MGEMRDVSFKTRNKTVDSGTVYAAVFDGITEKLVYEQQEMETRGSGWSLLFIDGLLLRVTKISPFSGGSYVEVPQCIKRKFAVINVRNADQQCFKWAILCKYNKNKKHRDQWNAGYIDLEKSTSIRFDGIDFPTPLKQIIRFERNNPSMSINVFALDDKNNVYPLRITKSRTSTDHVDLLYVTEPGNSHYCYISNFSRLVSKQRTEGKRHEYYCKRCLNAFTNQPLKTQPSGQAGVDEHIKMCGKFKEARAVLPAPDSDQSVLRFKNTRREEPVPVVVYADMESLLVRAEQQVSKYCTVTQDHQAMSYCFYVVRDSKVLPKNICDGLPNEPVLYRGPDAAKHFITTLVTIGKRISDIMNVNIDVTALTPEEQLRFDTTKNCELCSIRFTDKVKKVKDHNHWTARFRSVLCNKCNLQRRPPAFMPVIIHGLSNYDSHMIIPELAYDDKDIYIIAQSEEKYIMFSKTINDYFRIRFIDSYRFLQASLSKLTATLSTPDFVHTHKVFESLELVTRKSVFPYEYVDCWERLEETRLPPRDQFYSSITHQTVSEEDYEHGKKMWQHFNCNTLGDYSDKYLLVDVMILADVFEKFRKESLTNYKLDPALYFSCSNYRSTQC